MIIEWKTNICMAYDNFLLSIQTN